MTHGKNLNIIDNYYKGNYNVITNVGGIFMDTVMQFRVDNNLKKQATETFEKIGIDLSTAIRMFLKKSVQVEGLPFSTNNERNYEYISAMDNIQAIQDEAIKNGTSGMSLEDINAEIDAYRKGL